MSPDLHRYLTSDAEILAAKLLHRDVRFTIDATNFRLSAITLSRPGKQSWVENLDGRLEQLRELLDQLYEKFAALI